MSMQLVKKKINCAKLYLAETMSMVSIELQVMQTLIEQWRRKSSSLVRKLGEPAHRLQLAPIAIRQRRAISTRQRLIRR